MTQSQLTTALAPVPVPQAPQVRELLQTLTGRDVDVAAGRPVLPEREPALVAVYVTDELVPGAVVACDLSFAAHAGAALGAVPVAEVVECLTSGSLSADLAENVAEVLNVLAAALNAPGTPALRLSEVHAAGEQLPSEVQAALHYVMRRADLQLEVAGYGAGRLSAVSIG